MLITLMMKANLLCSVPALSAMREWWITSCQLEPTLMSKNTGTTTTLDNLNTDKFKFNVKSFPF